MGNLSVAMIFMRSSTPACVNSRHAPGIQRRRHRRVCDITLSRMMESSNTKALQNVNIFRHNSRQWHKNPHSHAYVCVAGDTSSGIDICISISSADHRPGLPYTPIICACGEIVIQGTTRYLEISPSTHVTRARASARKNPGRFNCTANVRDYSWRTVVCASHSANQPASQPATVRQRKHEIRTKRVGNLST